MRVTIKLFATLSRGRFDIQEWDLPLGATVAEILKHLEVDKEVHLIFVNGRHAQSSTRLMDGDTVALFPPIGGG
jgi:sulfur-carrier protein